MKVTIKQQTEGNPGFVGEERFDVQIASDQITLFNQSDDGSEVFVRLSCGATLCVDIDYGEFIKKLNVAMKNTGKVTK